MIRFEEVSSGKIFDRLNFRIGAGALCKVITRSNHDKQVLFDMLLSLRKLDGGRIFLAGQDIYALSGGELLKIFRRVGMCLGGSPLISNLRVWENIVLPACYHRNALPSGLEGRVVEFYLSMGYEERQLGAYLGRSPFGLSNQEKKLISIIRAMLTDPELIIYDSPFEEMEAGMAERLEKVMTGFHQAGNGRASVFISSREESPGLVSAGTVFI